MATGSEILPEFSRILAHGNGKNEIKQRNKARRDWVGKVKRALKKMKSRGPSYSSGRQSSAGRYAPKQWMNYLLTSTIIHSTPWGSTIINIRQCYRRQKKYNEIQLTKTKRLQQSKNVKQCLPFCQMASIFNYIDYLLQWLTSPRD